MKNNKTLISKLKFRNLDNNFVPIKKLSFRKIQSAKNKEIPTIKINKYLQFIKVKGIVNDLLSEKEENKNLSNLLLIRENLKYIINPNKSLDVTLRKNPDNISFFKSYNRQIKYFMNKNHQKIFCSSGNLCRFLTFGSGFLSCLCFVDSGFLSCQIQIVFLSKINVEIGSGNLSQFLHSYAFSYPKNQFGE